MGRHETVVEVAGPWSLATSRRFWEGFAPAELVAQEDRAGRDGGVLRTVFICEADWRRAEAVVRQDEDGAVRVAVEGEGDLDAAVAQVARFLALDVDGREWPAVGARDPVIGAAQARLPGFRPCGFHSPYEAAAWAVLAQRVRIPQAAAVRASLTERFGENGAFPAPERLRAATAGSGLGLPGRKDEYLAAVAEAALDGQLDGHTLRAMDVSDALASVQEITGLGPFAAELVVLRGANAPDGVPRHERRLEAEVARRYGPGASVASVSDEWRPFRTWAAVHLRALAADG